MVKTTTLLMALFLAELLVSGCSSGRTAYTHSYENVMIESLPDPRIDFMVRYNDNQITMIMYNGSTDEILVVNSLMGARNNLSVTRKDNGQSINPSRKHSITYAFTSEWIYPGRVATRRFTTKHLKEGLKELGLSMDEVDIAGKLTFVRPDYTGQPHHEWVY